MSEVDAIHAAMSGFSLAKREITYAPGFSLDRDGTVFLGHQKVPTMTVRSRLGVQCLAVSLSGSTPEVTDSVVGRSVPVWRLLSQCWYDSKLILPRDGNTLDWRSDNVVVIDSVTGPAGGGGIADPDEILLAWVIYQRDGIHCWQLPEKTGLVMYEADQFHRLIADILSAGIQ